MKMMVILIVISALGTILNGTERLRIQRTSGDHPNYGIIKIGQNTEKIHRDLRRLAVTQTSVKNHQLTLI